MGHPQQGMHAKLFHLKWREDIEFDTQFGQDLGAIGKLWRCQHIGRFIHQITGQVIALGDSALRFKGFTCCCKLAGFKCQRRKHRRYVVFCLVGVKTVAAQQGTRSQQTCGFRRIDFVCGNWHGANGCGLGFGCQKQSGDRAAQIFNGVARNILCLAKPNQNQAVNVGHWCHKLEDLVFLALEISEFHELEQILHCRKCQTWGRFSPFGHW